MKDQKEKSTLPEEILERFIQALEGPANRHVERVLKNKIFLGIMGAGLTLTARSYLALRDLDPKILIRGVKSAQGGV